MGGGHVCTRTGGGQGRCICRWHRGMHLHDWNVHTCAWATHKRVPRAGMHMHTCVSQSGTCPDRLDLACTFAQMCMQHVHTPTNKHVHGSGVSVTHMYRPGTHGLSTRAHTHGSGRHVGIHVHGPGTHMALTHVHARAWTWSEYTHMQGADMHVNVHTCMGMHLAKLCTHMCVGPVHMCIGQTYKDQTHVHIHTDQPHAPHVTGPGTHRHVNAMDGAIQCAQVCMEQVHTCSVA